MPLKKLYDLFIVILSDTGKFIDELIDGTSPWPRRYRWFSALAAKLWKHTQRLPGLGRAPTTTMTVVCLMAVLFYLIGVYGVLTGIRIPLAAQQPEAGFHEILIASFITSFCIGCSFRQGLRLMRHAGRLWRLAPLLAKVQTAALLVSASAGTAAMPLLSLTT